jgi:hypothetical protein
MKLKWNYFPDPSINPVNARGHKKADKFVGRTTKMGVEQYQDYTLYKNVDHEGLRGRHLNDEQLCVDWRHEFPNAVKYRPFHVQGVRRDYLKGRVQQATGTGSSHGVRGSSGEIIGAGSA